MKILHIINSFDPGGAEVFVRDLSVNMSKNGHKLHICCIQEASSQSFAELFEKILNTNNISTSLISRGSRNSFFRAGFSLRKIAADFSPDIIHCHSFYGVFYTIFSMKGIKTVYTHHNIAFQNGIWPFKLFDWVVSRYISISKECDKTLSKVTGKDTTLIYNGIDHDRIKKNNTIKRRGNCVRIISVGAMSPQKNYSLLVEVVAILLQESPQLKGKVEFFIVGDGEDMNVVSNAIKDFQIQDTVKLLGNISNVGDWLNSADIYLMTSLFEGLPIALIEAITAGLPVVCTDVGGCRELVLEGENGFLVQEGNRKGIVSALIKLILDECLRLQFRNGSIEHSKNFTIEKSALSHLDVYGDVVNSNH